MCSSVLGLLLIVSLPVTLVDSKTQYVQPLIMGMQMAIPYDIANIFIRPIAGVTSVILSIGLALIILFGIITSPFGYFFGIPSRAYVMGGNPATEPTVKRSMGGLPEFGVDAFWLIPEEFSSRSCQLFTSCYAHGALYHVPQKLIKVYMFFSTNLVNMDEDFQGAILTGIKDNLECEKVYAACDKSIFSIIINTLIRLLPDRARRKTKTIVHT